MDTGALARLTGELALALVGRLAIGMMWNTSTSGEPVHEAWNTGVLNWITAFEIRQMCMTLPSTRLSFTPNWCPDTFAPGT